MAQLISADGIVTHVHPANGKKFTLEELQAFVGGYIQIVEGKMYDTPTGKTRFRMVVDEEGKLKQKPRNIVATGLFRELCSNRMPGDFIVGPALVLDKGEGM